MSLLVSEAGYLIRKSTKELDHRHDHIFIHIPENIPAIFKSENIKQNIMKLHLKFELFLFHPDTLSPQSLTLTFRNPFAKLLRFYIYSPYKREGLY